MTLRICLISISLILASPYAGAQEYYGDFLDKLRGVFIPAKPRPLFKLESDFRFKDPNGLLWTTPAGTEVDGASIPQSFWTFIGGPFEGPYIDASVIHDYYCRTKERTAHDTHRNFYYGMLAEQVPKWKANLMYWAVSTYGPSWILERRVVMNQNCTSSLDQVMSCTTIPTTENVTVTIPPVDLSDPVVLAAAISKMNAVARTLLTSNGEFLDVTTTGPVKATAENIQASSDTYRKVFASKDFTSSTAKLGILSQASGKNVADVKPWNDNRIPRFSEAVVLTPQTIQKVKESKPFTLDPRSKDLLVDRVDIRTLETTTHIQAMDR
jgi:hypothetical protein